MGTIFVHLSICQGPSPQELLEVSIGLKLISSIEAQ